MLKDIEKAYGNNQVIKNLNLEIKDGEFLVILGPSGCGKSTLLNLISGLLDLNSGSIYFDDINMSKATPKERNVSMVFQDYALFPDMNVYQNIAFGLQIRKYKKNEIEEIVNKVAIKLKIDNLLKRKPKELSGGEQQRVAIARAIVKNPTVYLFDEPLSNLDVNLKSEFMELIKNLHEETKKTFVYVTHAQNEALMLADRIVVMNEGEIVQIDSPINLYKNPNSLFVANFIGEPKINILASTDSNFKIGIRPDAIKIVDKGYDKETFEADVIGNEFLGNGYILKVRIADRELRIFSQNFFDIGCRIIVCFIEGSILLFDENGNSVEASNKLEALKMILRRKENEK